MKTSRAVLAGAVMPHPPILMPGVHDGSHQAEKTDRAMRDVAGKLLATHPDTIVIISPHAPMFSDFLFIYDGPEASGHFGRFGAMKTAFSFQQDTALRDRLIEELEQADISGGCLSQSQMRRLQVSRDLDHGVLVPMYYLKQQKPDLQILAMSCSHLPLPEIYRAGQALAAAAEQLDRRIVIIASGDQSHKVNEASPYGVNPAGIVYDQAVCDGLRSGRALDLLSIDPDMAGRAAECGYRSIVMMLGAFSRQALHGELLSYEAPYGIGYCVGVLAPSSEAENQPDAFEQLQISRRNQLRRHQEAASFPVQIAWQTLSGRLLEGRQLSSGDISGEAADLEHWLSLRAGVFVTLHKWGELRGCIGTTEPTQASVVQEIIHNAVQAAFHDPRFDPLSPDELNDLQISVDVLVEPEPVDDRSQLDPKAYGVIVSHGGRRGLLLPDLDGVDTIEEQLAIACRKAGLSEQSPYRIERFSVTRYT